MKGSGQEPAGVLLVQIYEDLACEDEATRMSAAYSLLVHAQSHEDQIKTILTRLFRGLCSGRKAARLGFATALTELLYQSTKKESENTPSVADIITIWEQQTKPEGGTSGQEERDHHFGRLFGGEAIVKSEILLIKRDSAQWDRLLDLVCALALQKPWTRQACGWILYQCVGTSLRTHQHFAVQILDKLTQHKLIRTPEGLAIWIAVKETHPAARLPKHIWQNNDPLSFKDLQTLADVLKDAKASSKSGTEIEMQGSAIWAANLHFVWEIVLAKIFVETDKEDASRKELVKQFWTVAVDQALFAASNSKERKHWGLLVMLRTLEIAPADLADVVFSQNAVDCLVKSLKAADTYLQRSTQLVMQKMQESAEKSPSQADVYILGLLEATALADIDQITKTKTIENLLGVCTPEALLRLAANVNGILINTISVGGANIVQRLRSVLDFEIKLITHQVNQSIKTTIPLSRGAIHAMLGTWISLAVTKSALDDPTKKLILEKIQLAMDQLLKLGREGIHLVIKIISQIRSIDLDSMIEAEPEIVVFIKAGWKRFGALEIQKDQDDKDTTDGLLLLYGLILFQVHSGDTEAIQILRELLDLEAGAMSGNKASKEAILNNEADALVEILLSFASRPSKFLRRITLIIFETFTAKITRDGLQSLTDILEAKETKAGQSELFEANGDQDMEGDSDEDEEDGDSDAEMLDSDVEIVDASDSSSTDDDSSTSGSDDPDTDEDATMQDADDDDNNETALLALETSLASALGTRKLTQADVATGSSSTSDSDSDMTDSEMLAIDQKLAEVFRNRANTVSQKRDQKSAKENITNFKNRVLDMIEVYIRKEHLNSRSLDLLLPLLILTRTTSTKQLADRATKILLSFCKRCSGLDRVSTVSAPQSKTKTKSKSKHAAPEASETTTTPDFTLSTLHALLTDLHTEIQIPHTSNAHKAAGSKSSILVVKTLLKAGTGMDEMEAVYAETTRRMQDSVGGGGGELSKAQKGFMEDWQNFKTSVKGKLKSGQ